MIFALNKEFLPAPKWRIFYSYKLKRLPDGYRTLIKEAMTSGTLSKNDFHRRLKAIRKMWIRVIPKIEDETGLTEDQMSKYYLERILHQT